MSAELYTMPGCGYCVRAKKLLESKGMAFTEIDVRAGTPEQAEAARAALIERVEAASGSVPKTMPQIFLDGEYVGGFDALSERLA